MLQVYRAAICTHAEFGNGQDDALVCVSAGDMPGGVRINSISACDMTWELTGQQYIGM
ncbi:hypothetical protein [Bacillus marinisedimentorum]|uniref:hypothetical protein n=1 Tax=Bacillus marinisedimentorum TaxID=1821260 RepID=UPI00147090F6|nr:hypothetical protein [Bacillus marinisedimentorum]